MHFKSNNLIAFFLIPILGGCSVDIEPPAPIVNQHLVDASLKSEFDQALIKSFVSVSGFPDFADLVKYDIEIYKIKYI